MFKRVMLCCKINEFYKVCGRELYNAPAHTTLRDVNDDNFLSDVRYDISEILPCAPNAKAKALLTKLDRDIITYSECKSTLLSTIITAVLTVLLLWVSVSTIEVAVKNLDDTDYSPINLWAMLFDAEEPVHTRYTAEGRYYTNGTVVTTDGNEWTYSTDTISDKTPYDGMPVHIGFDDNGTPSDIYDDVVLGLVWDINTSVYDDLEDALGDKFELTRDGNNIHIGGIK